MKRESPSKTWDLIVIGSGPGGQRAAIQAAKLGKSALIIEKDKLGGACLHRGTIPSKTLREAALSATVDSHILTNVMDWKRYVIDQEEEVVRNQLERNSIKSIYGTASFVSPEEIQVVSKDSVEKHRAKFFVIATGASPWKPPHVPFDGKTILDSDTVLNLEKIPDKMAVLGAGVIGAEYASIFSTMGISITLLDQKPKMLTWMDEEVVQSLIAHFNKSGIQVRLGAKIGEIRKKQNGDNSFVEISVDGKIETYNIALCCLGRVGNTVELGLDKAGICADERGLLEVNANYQTEVPHIYAVGDVIGSPGLASASYEQGRLASAHAFGLNQGKFPDSFPLGIYTIPEMSSVGVQESELITKKIPYIVGRAAYKEIARGKILGDDYGFLKLLFHRETKRLIGVHIIGVGATELVHIGQVAYILGADIHFFVNNVFNYPTLAETYKVAAYNALKELNVVSK